MASILPVDAQTRVLGLLAENDWQKIQNGLLRACRARFLIFVKFFLCQHLFLSNLFFHDFVFQDCFCPETFFPSNNSLEKIHMHDL